MRILFILENHYPNIGGVETLFKTLTENLVAQGYQVTILTQRFDTSLSKDEILHGVRIRRINFFNRYLFTLLGIFPAIYYAFKHDIIHTTSYNAGVPAFFAGLVSRKKVIITFHEVWGDLWMKLPYFTSLSLKAHQLFEKVLLRLPFDHYVAVSDYTRSSLITSGVRSDKITRIYNGIDYTQYNENAPQQKLTDTVFEFVYYGRLGISKGIDLILKAVAGLKKKNHKCLIHLIIPTQPKRLLEKVSRQMAEYDITDDIKITHSLPWNELMQELKKANAILIPSYSEGFGFVAAECSAMNKLIIHSGQGALKEVVSGKHICMVDLDAESLIAAMEQSLKGDFETTSIKRFELEETIKEYASLYKKIESKRTLKRIQ